MLQQEHYVHAKCTDFNLHMWTHDVLRMKSVCWVEENFIQGRSRIKSA